jgi:type II restriction/modification system DNA methylase subunit YeeA
MTPEQFVAKWSKIQQKERAAAQSHFNDVCALVGHRTPLEYDPTGQNFSFETQTVKPGDKKGFADVFFRDHFIWEYKGPHKNLEQAYAQLQLYRESLHNPPLLITCDIHTIIIHTNFNNYPTLHHPITFDDILKGDGVEKLRRAFFTPERFRPSQTQAEITKASADTFIAVADAMKRHQQVTSEVYTAEQLAHFLARLLFCLFAEDLGLLPQKIFSQMVRAQDREDVNLQFGLRNLFREMRSGGLFGFYKIREFNGTLFDDDFVPTIPDDLAQGLLQAAQQDWAQVDPSIFGTLFERVIDPDKRAQLGAHYTSVADILLIVEPVLMEPLRRKWDEVRRKAERHLTGLGELSGVESVLTDFAAEIAAIRVLDPACGSGNFLYVALRQLLDLQKEVIAYAARRGLPEIPLTVSPQQLYGIEINPYAHELAQITSWIGYLQWRYENGFKEVPSPILAPLHNIKRMDAIVAYDENGRPTEPLWPEAEIIISNPPFLGDKKMRRELGHSYVDDLRTLYHGRIPGQSDLVCYWFECARAMIEQKKASRAGLLATQGIRGGANRSVLHRIKETGDIFCAYSDRNWILEGATVHVSMVGFDDGSEVTRLLDGRKVNFINSDLRNFLDFSHLKRLRENEKLSFIGTQKTGPFDLTASQAQAMLAATDNPDGRPNSQVVKPWINALDITRRPRQMWIIDFGTRTSLEEAAQYVQPFTHIQNLVKPVRDKVRRQNHREKWWLFGETRPGMRLALSKLKRFIATPLVSKHRLFVWIATEVVPENLVVVIARDDNYFLGVLSSAIHERWARRLATQLREAESGTRYTPTTTFETFPFPWPPGQEPTEAEDERVGEIAHWARVLHRWRDAWLNPPPPNGLDVVYQKQLQNRTLTNLYNGLAYYRQTVKAGKPFLQSEFDKETRKSLGRAEVQELDDIHVGLDTAVLAAYGWPHHLNDEEILERLLALNLERAR